jgi:kumamolisin
MAKKTMVDFAPSYRTLPAGAQREADVPSDENIEVSVYLKPRSDATSGEEALPHQNRRAALHARRAIEHQDDIRLLTEFAVGSGLKVSTVDVGQRLVKLSGPASKMQEAFGTTLGLYRDGQHRFRGRKGALRLPEDVHAVVEAVLGLDTRQAAEPHFVQINKALDPAVITGHRPNEVGAIYSFPTGVTGVGQCIGIVELGGGFVASDNTAAFAAMGLATPPIIAVPVDGGQNAPGGSADGEVALDIQVCGGVAPGARIAVYFAPNTFQGFTDAVTGAVHDTANKPDVISISWGTAEINWTDQAIQAMNNALQDAATLGVSVFVAAGDHLAIDGIADGKVHVDYPASSPWAIGCGGTTVDTTGNAINSEVVWNEGANGWGTGGGISDKFQTVPTFQQGANLPANVSTGLKGRGVPDVAGDASGASGYLLVLHGQTAQFGGTSAVAPLWAGLTALINQAASNPIGFFLPKLYQNPQLLRVITQGNNKPVNSTLGYSAGPGWSGCTGLGVPIGTALFQAFADSVTGNYIGHFSWGCGNNYGQFNITLNGDGTFGGTFPGKWVKQDGTLLLSFDNGPAKYAGTIDGNVGSGAMSTFTGSNGCWFLTKQGTTGFAAEAAAPAAHARQTHDASGNKA